MWVVKDGVKKGLFYKALANGTHEMSGTVLLHISIGIRHRHVFFKFWLTSKQKKSVGTSVGLIRVNTMELLKKLYSLFNKL